MVGPAAVTIGGRTRAADRGLEVPHEVGLLGVAESRARAWRCGRRRVEPLGRLVQPLAQDHPFRRHADVFARQLVQVPLASPVPVDDVVHFQDRSIGEDGIHEAVDGGAVDVQLRPT